MTVRVQILGLLLGAMAGLLAPQAALATAATVEQVSANLDAACAVDGAGNPIDLTACLTAVGAAIQAAESGDQTFQVAVGFLLGDLAVALPGLADDIIELINEAGNNSLALGAQNALGSNWGGVPLIFSPA